ncbi:hypothetical protein K435DRAFT_162915 [Dendrothele bispora CBS 962.96]|uniref:Uncharacterized protein n=1 Tax=Dendrothele bispora (strain CBS 962.96) TaxID=1314807 RepID=A0A4S8LXN1_DENBC|nr:hypothetical protein K435DRAFT_162915 [Dendrothele bispora CBS 962.96]
MAWRHRKDIRQRLGKTVKMSFKIQKILVLLSQSGFVYCIIWISNICVIIFSKDISTPSLGIYSDAMPLIAALYPALIIMFTTLEDYRYGSQENQVILTRSIKFASGSQRGQLSDYMPENGHSQQETSGFISDQTLP